MAENTEKLKFVVSEVQSFCGHLLGSLEAAERGEPLKSAFTKSTAGAKPAAGGKAATGLRAKRKPTAFNIFVQKKHEQLKAAGISQSADTGTYFQQATAAWSQLSEEQKEAYREKFSKDPNDPTLANLPTAGGGNESPKRKHVELETADDGDALDRKERKKKKKDKKKKSKKHDHEDE